MPSLDFLQHLEILTIFAQNTVILRARMMLVMTTESTETSPSIPTINNQVTNQLFQSPHSCSLTIALLCVEAACFVTFLLKLPLNFPKKSIKEEWVVYGVYVKTVINITRF